MWASCSPRILGDAEQGTAGFIESENHKSFHIEKTSSLGKRENELTLTLPSLSGCKQEWWFLLNMVRVGGISRAVLPLRLLGTSPKHQDVPYRTEGQACSGNGTPPTLQPIFHFCLLCERPSWHLSHCGSGPRPGSRASHSCLVPSVIFHLAQVLSKERKKCLFCMTLIFLKNTGKLLRR